MNFIYFFILCLALSATQAQELSEPTVTTDPLADEDLVLEEKIQADVLYEKYKNLVTRVSVQGKGDKDRVSQATAFVVNGAEGLLMTTYRSVADKAINSSRYKLSVNYLSSEIPVDIVYVDIVTDLAILKTTKGETFSGQLKISNLSLSTSGEAMYSMGFPKDQNLNVVAGSYVGSQNLGYSKVTQAILGLSSGMEGGPCFNDKGEVIGVSRSLDISTNHYAGLATLPQIHAMLNNGRRNGSPNFYLSKIPIPEQIRYNVTSYEKLYQRKIAEKFPEFKIEQLNFSFPVDGVQCEITAGRTSRPNYYNCKNESIAYLGKNIPAFSFSSYAYLVEDTPSAKNNFYALFEKQSADIEKELRGYLDRRPSSKNPEIPDKPVYLQEKYCNFHRIKNKNDTKIIARVCSSPLPHLPGVYVTFVKTDVVDSQKRRISFHSTLQGMSMEKTAFILNHFWNSIYEDKGT